MPPAAGRAIVRVVPQVPSPFNFDLVRASLGPELAAPYENALGAVPWLTAGTLAWPAADAALVLDRWARWSAGLPAHVLTAVRLGVCEVAIDVAFIGDPWAVPAHLASLRALEPVGDTVALAGPFNLRLPASVCAAAVPLRAVPPAAALLAAADGAPPGVCLGLRREPDGGVALIGVAAAGEKPRALAAVDQAARALLERAAA
jgi:hypothetical protein